MSLRDALLKAGKVSKKQAQAAATEKRKKRKKKGGHKVEADSRTAADARAEQRESQVAAANRERAEAQRIEREAHEQAARLADLLRAWERRPSPRASRPWHFVRADHRIGRVLVDRTLAEELEHGTVAIVATDTDAVRFIKREAIDKLHAWAPGAIRFYVGPGGPDDPLIRPDKRDLRRK